MKKDPADREAMLAKLRALLAVSRDPGASEGEVFNASQALHRILARYNIDMDEVTAAAEVLIEPRRVPGKYNETWRKDCFQMAARMFMCNYVFKSQPGNKTAAVIHILIGEEHNTAVAAEMGAYFESSINRLANEAARTASLGEVGHTTRHQFIRSFRLSASDRLSSRIEEYINAAKAGTAEYAPGENMPALLSLYERSDELYQRWLESQGIKITTVTSRDQQLSAAGRIAGRRAGDSISLSTQISDKSSAFALPSS